MKNVVHLLLLTCVFFTLSCNSDNTQSRVQPTVNDSVAVERPAAGTTEPAAQPQPDIAPQDREVKATTELCACVNSFLADMSPQVRQVIIKAGNSSTPLQTLAIELQQVKGTAEQEQLLRELEKFENNPQLQRCSESIKQKYKLNENDEASGKKLMKAAKENKNCEVVYALMKIGLEQEANARATSN